METQQTAKEAYLRREQAVILTVLDKLFKEEFRSLIRCFDDPKDVVERRKNEKTATQVSRDRPVPLQDPRRW